MVVDPDAGPPERRAAKNSIGISFLSQLLYFALLVMSGPVKISGL
jgi:hypothetical protein